MPEHLGSAAVPEEAAPLSSEDEKRPVVAFLRLAGWSEEHIALVVAAHKRGEVFKHTLTLSAERPHD